MIDGLSAILHINAMSLDNSIEENTMESAHGGNEPVEWARVATVAGIQLATIIAGRLESYGILTRVTQEAAGVSVFPVNVGILSQAHVWVPQESLERAMEILASNEDIDIDVIEDE
jgi:hypothetical protein